MKISVFLIFLILIYKDKQAKQLLTPYFCIYTVMFGKNILIKSSSPITDRITISERSCSFDGKKRVQTHQKLL